MADGWTRADLVSWAGTLVAGEPDISNGSHGTAADLDQLCRAVTRAVPVSGAVISLMTHGGPTGIVASSDAVWRDVEELQFILGEGPCWDAFESGRPVLAEDVRAGDEARWVGYRAAAIEHGVRAVFAFPLQIHFARVGVMDVYRNAPGGLDDHSLALILAFAECATALLVDGQEAAGAGEIPSGVDHALGSRFEAYQAQGMVMVQLGVPLADAMARLRAYAYANDRTLGQVARQVVSRSLSFEPEDAASGTEKGSES